MNSNLIRNIDLSRSPHSLLLLFLLVLLHCLFLVSLNIVLISNILIFLLKVVFVLARGIYAKKIAPPLPSAASSKFSNSAHKHRDKDAE